MPRKLFRSVSLVLLLVFMASAGLAQDQARDFSAQSARIHRGLNGRQLTPPSQATPRQVVDEFLLSRGHNASTLGTLVAAGENPDQRSGIRHIRLEQELDGLKVYGTYVKAGVNSRGELVSLIENLAGISDAGLVSTEIGPEAALTSVLAQYYPGLGTPQALRTSGNTTFFASSGFFSEDPSATRVAVPMANGALHTGYLISTWDRENVLRYTVVGRNGRILVEELRTNTDRYNIFKDHPGVSPQTIENGPGTGNAESPQGWLINNTSTTTIGNNVDAYLDRDNNNVADPGGRPTSASGEFLHVADLSQAPTITVNQMVAVQNLFYLNNIIHDKLYKHGFTEAAGNFQTNNFGKGGAGNDPVNAEAQDGGGTNNANFSTPSDGSRPRMQMYIWTQTNPNRDGDLDSDIVWHEYGHGLTWRMIGGMSGPLAGAIGEGMGDVLSILANNNDAVGEYSYNRTAGIRRYRYANYPLTYGDVTGSSVHNDGEIYAATIWRLWELWQQNGLSKDLLYDYLVGGMNFTPSTPAYEDMRDGILTRIGSQSNPGYCVVWQAFAQFGIGEGANGATKGGGGPFGGGKVTITESFTVPSVCSGGGGNTAPTVTITNPSSNTTITEGTAINFTGTAGDDEDGDLTSSIEWASSLSGSLGTGGSVTATLSVGTHTITASVTDSGNLSGSATRTVTVNSSNPGGINLLATGYKVKGLQKADLSWTGASGSVEIKRNGNIIATVASGNSYTDNINNKGGGTYVYQVCNAGTTTCSNTATVVF